MDLSTGPTSNCIGSPVNFSTTSMYLAEASTLISSVSFGGLPSPVRVCGRAARSRAVAAGSGGRRASRFCDVLVARGVVSAGSAGAPKLG